MTLENPSLGSDSLEMDNDSLSSAKAAFDDFLGEVRDSINTSVNNGGNVVQSSLDTITSSITSIKEGASEAVDGVLSKVFSTFDQTGELASDRLTSFSSGLREATQTATGTSIDVLRVAITAVEESIAKGASFVVYSYGPAKDLLPPKIRGALNLSEERVTQILRPIGATFQQVYIAIEGLEKRLGLDPNDPVVPFVLFLGTSATLWGFYRVWVYGGYSGDLSPQLTLELLAGKEDAILIDVRPEVDIVYMKVLRERDGIPDLRRAARFRYAIVTLPEVDGPVRKLLKGGRDLDDILTAVVIRNLKAVQVIVMDVDGSRSKGIARSLRKLGVKRPYLVQGGFQSWVKQGIQAKELKPETVLTILNEGFAAASYALLEWEKTLQFIAIIGLSQRVASYNGPEDFKQDVRRLLSPVRLGVQTFSWAARKLENNRIGLPT
ncbi:uncharacterized protein LOC133667900 isoform X1 [Populus nigra]|uniref:uncharacterized protein LOC133667900 isoform X1 n=4 Tax=Populus nigra TaxID=3691 RepID=UPI002B266B8F|nr:uncharacterized protein LOC133667900 isoform X1 [Populus nigra]XP_061943590.1 uncharacterized protein LOC133667900 isoform X1 [Populus nigra]